jgi:hypothetical protein
MQGDGAGGTTPQTAPAAREQCNTTTRDVTMNPFGNRDEPIAPEWFRPHLRPWLRNLLWHFRNPLHNFTHYVIGIAGREFTVTRSCPDSDNDGFADGGGWLRCTLQYGGGSRPYVSYAGRSHFYIGFHPASGKFGVRLTR